MTQHPDIENFAKEIATHLAKNPQARDTVEGITQWWLSPRPERPLEVVQQALDLLEARGRVMKTKISGEKWVYSSPQPRESRRNSSQAKRQLMILLGIVFGIFCSTTTHAGLLGGADDKPRSDGFKLMEAKDEKKLSRHDLLRQKEPDKPWENVQTPLSSDSSGEIRAVQEGTQDTERKIKQRRTARSQKRKKERKEDSADFLYGPGQSVLGSRNDPSEKREERTEISPQSKQREFYKTPGERRMLYQANQADKEKILKEYDQNGDGTISADELVNVTNQLKAVINENQGRWSQLDGKNSGKRQEVSENQTRGKGPLSIQVEVETPPGK